MMNEGLIIHDGKAAGHTDKLWSWNSSMDDFQHVVIIVESFMDGPL